MELLKSGVDRAVIALWLGHDRRTPLGRRDYAILLVTSATIVTASTGSARSHDLRQLVMFEVAR